MASPAPPSVCVAPSGAAGRARWLISHQGFREHGLPSRQTAASVSEPACCGTAFPHAQQAPYRAAADRLLCFRSPRSVNWNGGPGQTNRIVVPTLISRSLDSTSVRSARLCCGCHSRSVPEAGSPLSCPPAQLSLQTGEWSMESEPRGLWLRCISGTHPQRLCAVDLRLGPGTGSSHSSGAVPSRVCLCGAREISEPGPPALPGSSGRQAARGGGGGKGCGCEQWAESPGASEGALRHPAPVGPPWGDPSEQWTPLRPDFTCLKQFYQGCWHWAPSLRLW